MPNNMPNNMLINLLINELLRLPTSMSDSERTGVPGRSSPTPCSAWMKSSSAGKRLAPEPWMARSRADIEVASSLLMPINSGVLSEL